MSSVSWSFGVSDNWLDATRWSGGAPPAAGDDVYFGQPGPYTVTLNSAVTINSLTFDAVGAILTEPPAGSLDVAGAVNLLAGTLRLGGANTLGSINESGGVLGLYDANAIGSATLALTGGEVTGMTTETVANHLTLGGSGFTIDAATGASVDFGGGGWTLDDSHSPTVQFGSAARAGTVVWHTTGASTISGGASYAVDVAGGVLEAGDGFFGFLLQNDSSTTIAAGARIDLHGVSVEMVNLQGSGDIVDSGAAVLLAVKGGFFNGVISGAIAVDFIASTELVGANTYTGGTTIDSGQYLALAGGGRIAGAIADNGTLYNFETSGQVILGAISGSGVLDQEGAGALVLDQASTFTGGANILAGRVSIGNGAALGTGAVVVDGAELVASATLTMPDSLTLRDTVILAAATGKTLNLTGGGFTTWDASAAPLTVIFGDGADKGTVLIDNGGFTVNFTNPIHIEVAAGTLKVGDNIFGIVTSHSTDTKVATGATLDLGGFSLTVPSLTSTGTITNSSSTTASLQTENGSTIGGTVTGKVNLDVVGGFTTLTGADSASGGATVASGGALQLGAGGAAGTLAGPIDVEGGFYVDESGKVALGGVVSGAGFVYQYGSGSTTLTGVNTYTGGTYIQRGVLIAANAAALGSGGKITLIGGELLGAANETLSHDLTTSGTVTLAAAHATTLTLATANATFGQGTIAFGAAGEDGTTILKVSSTMSVGPKTVVQVRAGTLKAGDAFALSFLLQFSIATTIDAGATLDGNGQSLGFDNLTGAGTLTDFGGKTLSLYGVNNFSGVVAGICNLAISGTTSLGGAETFNGKATIFDQALTVSGPFKEDVVFSGGGLLVLPVPANFTGRIFGFASGATIDLKNITKGAAASVSYDAATHVLTVTDGTHTDHLTFLGGYVLGNFKASSDFGGGTNISWQVPPSHVIGAAGGVRDAFVSAMAGFAAPAGGEASLPGAMRHEAAAMLVAPRTVAA